MLLLIGIALIVVGATDYAIALAMARGRAGTGLGGDSQVAPAARILRLTGALTFAAGVVLTVIGLAS